MKLRFIVSALSMLLAATFLLGSPMTALAAPNDVAANTSIDNKAILTYTVGGGGNITLYSAPGAGNSDTSNTGLATTFVVDQKIRPFVTAVSGATVFQSGTGQALTFTVTNDGNVSDIYTLSVLRSGVALTTLAGVTLYEEDDTTPGFQIGEDTPLGLASATPTITLDWTAGNNQTTIYVVADTEAGPFSNGDLETYHLLATTTATKDVDGIDQADGLDTVYADSTGTSDTGGVDNSPSDPDGIHSASANYTYGDVSLNILKEEMVWYDPYGLNYHLPGVYVQYTITITNNGPSTQEAVLTSISDTIQIADVTFDTTFVDSNGTPAAAPAGAVEVSWDRTDNGAGSGSSIYAVGSSVVAYNAGTGALSLNLANAVDADAGNGYSAGGIKYAAAPLAADTVTIKYNVRINDTFTP